jgi:hypothetical protein
MLKEKIMATILIFLLSLLSINAQADVIVDKTDVTITGGDSFTLIYNLSGSKQANCIASVAIAPDPEGFILNFDDSFEIPSTFYLHINTSILLCPGVYTITVMFYGMSAEQMSVVSKKHIAPFSPAFIPENNDTISQNNNDTHPIPEDETMHLFDDGKFPDNSIPYYILIISIILLFIIATLVFLYLLSRKKEAKK